ncbi:MAG: hypothetical protein JNK38_18320 [Acidobacteria bacterium]|nr:hypothetical protein [Acidobacteriota bacterium]
MPIKQKTGRLIFLRAHERGTGYGPPTDFLDAEVIVRFEGDGSKAYGFQLRSDDKLPAAQAMFALLQDAFSANAPVTIDFDEIAGRNHHRLFRVWRNL